MKKRSHAFFLALFSTVTLAQAPKVATTEKLANGLTPAQNKKAISTSLIAVQEEMIRLLVFSALLNSKGVSTEVLTIPKEVETKYQSFRLAYLGATVVVPVTTLTTTYSVKRFSEELRSLMTPVNMLIDYIKPLSEKSSALAAKLSNALYIDASSKLSGRSFAAAWKFVEPVVRVLTSKTALITMGTASGVSSVGMASIVMMNPTTEGILDYATARKILGYNKYVNSQLDDIIRKLGVVFSLSAAKQAVLKEKIEELLIRKAVENQFAMDKDYSLDILQVMESHQIISAESAVVAKNLREVFSTATAYAPSQSEVMELKESMDSLVVICAMLETILMNDKGMSEEIEKEIRQKLANANRTLRVVQTNFLK